MERLPNIRHEVPKHAMWMTKHEALKHQKDVISRWKPQSEVFWLTYGRPVLVAAASLSGMYFNHRFRRKLKLLDYGSMPTMFGLTAGPAVITTVLHTEYVLNKLLVLEFSCPLCLVSKSALYQCATGLLMPLIITPLANFSITAGSGVYNTPHVSDLKGIMNVIRRVYQPMMPTITLIFTLHALLAGFITHSQIKSIFHIHDVQYLLDEEPK